MSYDSYFPDLYKEEKLLRSHGFNRWPNEEELVHYLFNVNDKIDALASSLELEVQPDIRGRWIVSRPDSESLPPFTGRRCE